MTWPEVQHRRRGCRFHDQLEVVLDQDHRQPLLVERHQELPAARTPRWRRTPPPAHRGRAASASVPAPGRSRGGAAQRRRAHRQRGHPRWRARHVRVTTSPPPPAASALAAQLRLTHHDLAEGIVLCDAGACPPALLRGRSCRVDGAAPSGRCAQSRRGRWCAGQPLTTLTVVPDFARRRRLETADHGRGGWSCRTVGPDQAIGLPSRTPGSEPHLPPAPRPSAALTPRSSGLAWARRCSRRRAPAPLPTATTPAAVRRPPGRRPPGVPRQKRMTKDQGRRHWSGRGGVRRAKRRISGRLVSTVRANDGTDDIGEAARHREDKDARGAGELVTRSGR